MKVITFLCSIPFVFLFIKRELKVLHLMKNTQNSNFFSSSFFYQMSSFSGIVSFLMLYQVEKLSVQNITVKMHALHCNYVSCQVSGLC